MKKSTQLAAALILGALFLAVGCSRNETEDVFEDTDQVEAIDLEQIDELDDDPEGDPGGRTASTTNTAPSTSTTIPRENRVYQVFRATGRCNNLQQSAQFAIVEGNRSQETIADSSVNRRNGFRTFSVKPENFNKFYKRTLDRAKEYTVFINDTGPNYKRLVTIPANAPVFNFLPTYRRSGYDWNCTGSTAFQLD